MHPTFSLKLCGGPQRQLGVGEKDKSFRAGQIQFQISISPSTSFSESLFLSFSLSLSRIKYDNTHKEYSTVPDSEELLNEW